ncbi:MAG: phenylalanine--tRNA ligase subunit beta [Clostridiales bacterium]|nr:phenylalanine--tRNA ligase subunit beta [Clostridiales bacterium]MBS5877477.1 phenylalanine--tRNA ligase subunit beta [Clostridiales bacterium]MDU0938864.1 phenylalanine--tRNA ligase subunit beta [Clostridiales bacterium]MDU1041496.1 phenylalanine--tRNA ligase subunit beta [Clostridiales bacterium]MDU3490008.1 phenylalanine--tRNA ligase subunit beta [Clostridiales bacterium]
MKTSMKWIRSLVPGISNVGDQEYRDAMTLSGTKVEGFEVLDKNLEKIVVAEVLKVDKHPDADKLVVCQLDIGADEPVQIVTGASNIKVGSSGQLVPAVLDGGKVAGGHSGEIPPEHGIRIKKGRLRGVESYGMMCALEELGVKAELFPDAPEDGIYIFPEGTVRPGDDAVKALGLDDTIFEYEVTNNRVDCYSVIGIAREAAATFGCELKIPEVKETGNSEKASDYISVEVKDPDLCSRYTARVVKNVKTGPSPAWMQERLRASGIRPINNVVDITNYVMEEYGQPMHAFDYDTIAGRKIIVRRAKEGETFVTLDEVERKLDSEMLMICDDEKAIGIAGIMGGNNSKITDDVRTLVFESATFNGTNIRKAAKRLSLRTDASGKFEKGLDPELALEAINRACALVEELGAGEVVGGAVDIYPEPVVKKEIKFEQEKINRLLGTDISAEEMLGYFKPLGIEYDQARGELIIPSFRQDLIRNADIAEEAARFYGYDRIPVSLPKGTGIASRVGGISFDEEIKARAMDIAEALGYSQALTYSFESPKVFDKLSLAPDAKERKTVVISNPLGEDFSIMRTLPVNGMLTSLSNNFNRRNGAVKLYELAKVYIPDEDPEKLPDERTEFTLGFYGKGDFFTLKGAVEVFFEKLGITGKREYENTGRYPFLHPGRQAEISYKGQTLAWLGEVHPEVASRYNLGERIYIAAVDLPTVMEHVSLEIKYTGIANFPVVSRDISLVMPKEVPVGRIEDIIEKRGGKLVESYKLFDVYEGDQIEEGFKSVAYSISFRACDRTLTDEDVNPVMDKIFADLKEAGYELRQ